MSFDTKALKKIAQACRQAGITSFKNSEFEIILSPDGPISNYKKRQSKASADVSSAATSLSNSLSETDLLLWSTGSLEAPNENQ